MAYGLKKHFYWGIGTGVGLAIMTAGAGSLKFGTDWSVSVMTGALLALVHLGLVAMGMPKNSRPSMISLISITRLALLGYLIFTALRNGIMPVPLTVGLAVVYMGLLGGLLISHARHH